MTDTTNTAPTPAAAAAAASQGLPNGVPAVVDKAPANETPKPATAAPAADLPVEGEAGDKGGFIYTATGDAGLDAALTFVGKNGFGPDHPAIKAAIKGDFGLLKANLAEKGVAGSDAYIMLAEKAFEKHNADVTQRREKDTAAVHEIVGGPDAWNAIQEWAGKNADPEEKTALQDMLGKGGKHAVIAAGFLASQYSRVNEGPKETVGAGPQVATVKGAAAVSSDALSPKDYAKAVADVRRTYKGNDFENAPEYKALRERRMRYQG